MQGYLITWLFYAVALQDYFLHKVYGKDTGNDTPICKKYFFIKYTIVKAEKLC